MLIRLGWYSAKPVRSEVLIRNGDVLQVGGLADRVKMVGKLLPLGLLFFIMEEVFCLKARQAQARV